MQLKLMSFLVKIRCALDEHSKGTFKEVKFSSQYAKEYQSIIYRLEKLKAEMQGKYHNIKKHLTDRVV
jgi:hypothetical protein